MSGPSLWWIDWRLAAGKAFRIALSRFFALLVLAVAFLVLLLSGGVDRFLADRWVITAILGSSVSAEEGRGIARKIGAFPSVRDTAYKDPEAAWKDFLSAYPGLESLRSVGGNPLTGYIEIRMRPEGLTEPAIGRVTSVLRPLPQVEKIFVGGEALPRLLKAKRWINAGFWGVFGFAAFLVSAFCLLQEKSRAMDLKDEIAFLSERGVPGRKVSLRRAGGAALTGAFLAALALGAGCGVLHAAGTAIPAVASVVGSVEELLVPGLLAAAGAFLLAAAVLSGVASLLGWRAAHAARE